MHSLSLLCISPIHVEINVNDFTDSISATPGPDYYTRTGMVLKIEEEGQIELFNFQYNCPLQQLAEPSPMPKPVSACIREVELDILLKNRLKMTIVLITISDIIDLTS